MGQQERPSFSQWRACSCWSVIFSGLIGLVVYIMVVMRKDCFKTDGSDCGWACSRDGEKCAWCAEDFALGSLCVRADAGTEGNCYGGSCEKCLSHRIDNMSISVHCAKEAGGVSYGIVWTLTILGLVSCIICFVCVLAVIFNREEDDQCEEETYDSSSGGAQNWKTWDDNYSYEDLTGLTSSARQPLLSHTHQTSADALLEAEHGKVYSRRNGVDTTVEDHLRRPTRSPTSTEHRADLSPTNRRTELTPEQYAHEQMKSWGYA